MFVKTFYFTRVCLSSSDLGGVTLHRGETPIPFGPLVSRSDGVAEEGEGESCGSSNLNGSRPRLYVYERGRGGRVRKKRFLQV